MNVAQKANEVYDHLIKNGFQGLKIIHHEKECVWHREYAIFILQFDDYFECENPYHSFDFHQFESDLVSYMQNQFPSCSVSYNKYTHEWEIIGEHYAAYYDDNIDALEELSSNEGHSIYDENN